MMRILLLLLWLTTAALAQHQASAIGEEFIADPEGVSVETWVSGLEVPWSLKFLPDGRALVSERPGRIRLIRDGKLVPEPYAVIESTAPRGEGGLMGLALHPEKPYVYLMHTTDRDNRILRLIDKGDRGVFDRIILDGIPKGANHNGGRIAFGPDGMLYATTGETFEGSMAQDLDSLGGKILRLTPEGEVPADNPFQGSYVYSYGHRNPQGLAWHPETGDLFSSEHGPSGEKGWRGHDEVNVIHAGGNYGWPVVIGAPGRPQFVDPIVYWEEAVPPGDIVFHRDALFMASLHSGGLVRLNLADDYRVISIERWFARRGEGSLHGRLRDVAVGPDGALYVTTSNRDGRGRPRPQDDRIFRLTW